MDKLGYTFYPKDWWTSDTFFKLPPELRYLYLEIISMMYINDGKWKANRQELFKRFGVDPMEKGWEVLESLFIIDGDTWSHPSVNKRLSRAIASKNNGKLGGRPQKEPRKPSLETYNNPPSEIEREKKEKGNEVARDLSWYRNQIDAIFIDQLPSDKKANLERAIQESWMHLLANPAELNVADSARCKRLLNTWLSRMPAAPQANQNRGKLQ